MLETLERDLVSVLGLEKFCELSIVDNGRINLLDNDAQLYIIRVQKLSWRVTGRQYEDLEDELRFWILEQLKSDVKRFV